MLSEAFLFAAVEIPEGGAAVVKIDTDLGHGHVVDDGDRLFLFSDLVDLFLDVSNVFNVPGILKLFVSQFARFGAIGSSITLICSHNFSSLSNAPSSSTAHALSFLFKFVVSFVATSFDCSFNFKISPSESILSSS